MMAQLIGLSRIFVASSSQLPQLNSSNVNNIAAFNLRVFAAMYVGATIVLFIRKEKVKNVRILLVKD